MEADFRSDFEADLRSDFGADFDADFGADFEADLRSDFDVDLRSDLEADLRSDFEADLRSDFEAARKVPFLVKNACVVGGSFLAGAIGTFGFVFFSLQGLRKGSRPPTDPKMPFPYWKNDYFVTQISSRYTIHLRIKKNQLKSGRDG